ncbi:3-dehydroquinate synthase [Poriferisphaera corsica]|uniref:3-dehydroquinate synthase n=1 Tax=Poriferisphaera corsica TaxID=2528020 RepID=A0A517YWN8_9BACT|nr:3-dehydroquinate synthase [Poriferisphaera corsica]QDU34658.1 3-dehydroquinate synthase [Poriferisphaera corsica]
MQPAIVDLVLPHTRYQIVIAPGLLSELGERVMQLAKHDLAACIIDENVQETWGKKAVESMAGAGYEMTSPVMLVGEEYKNLETFSKLHSALLDAKLERKSPVVAVGGGITGDVTGFVASSYLRGVPFVQCPTTLLAMVDASVGGKTGVNMPQGKNLVGAFHQPHLVLIDTETLSTLPERELLCGLAECVKHGVIRDPELFQWLHDNADKIKSLDKNTMVELVRWNVQIKATVVMNDEKEAGERAHLNFGHTFAHAIEASTGYNTFKHGEAVALGMVAATQLAVDAGRCDGDVLSRLIELQKALGLPCEAKLPDAEKLIEVMRHDKKVADGKIRLVLPDRIGAVSIVDDTPDVAIVAAWNAITVND